VVAVHDGDTISVMLHGRAERVRLEGIDCPERGQGYSKQAKRRTAELVYGKSVTLRTVGRDRYGRLIARVYAGDIDISLTLVREGYAWHFTRYSDDPQLAAAQKEAQQSGRGVWGQTYSPAPRAQRVR
jgi:endonuclease YncB( thermonuclease family)